MVEDIFRVLDLLQLDVDKESLGLKCIAGKNGLDKEIISGGVSFQVDRNIDLDITLQQKNWLRESWDNYSPELVTENITLNKFLVGLNYRF